MCQAAALTAVDRRGFGIEVIVKTTIMGSDPIMSGSLTPSATLWLKGSDHYVVA